MRAAPLPPDPYGLSIEHDIKRLLNDPSIKKAVRAAYKEMSDEGPTVAPDPVDPPETVVDQPEEAIAGAPAGAGRLNFSA